MLLRKIKLFVKEEKTKLKCLRSEIFVYQMAKVASYGVHKSLKQSGASVSHFHFLSNVPSFCVGHSRQEELLLGIRGRISAVFFRMVVRLWPRKFKIITLVRDPLGRNVSLMFQMFSDLLGPVLKAGGGASCEVDEQELLSRMFTRINQTYPALWFEQELKRVFGIDVLAYPFDKEKGYAVIRQGKVSVLVLRAEDLSQNEKVIGEFTGMAEFALKPTNRASQKWYANLYQRFLEEYRPDDELLDLLYDSDYMRHFYTAGQIKVFREKWLKDSGRNSE